MPRSPLERGRLSRPLRRRTARPVHPAPHSEALIHFAWGVAHDFSNLLQVILGFAEMLRAQHRDNPAVLDSVEEILTASHRARELIAHLLVIGRRNPPTPQRVDVGPLLQQAAARLQPQLGSKATLHVRVDTAPQYAILDPESLERILTLLCALAATGMPEGGAVTIRAARVAGRGRPACLRISVRDAGPGHDPALVRRMCEPFFMKRRAGLGNGWELAVAAGMMAQQQGSIAVETAPGRGTTVHLMFPAAASPAESS